ncbi:hypothetical protein Sviol_81330 [Streptomyces violascens]|uniref:Uncharacterized protein n=1 Tax=Streptomyces violascens TaxID=67381 RepID=A0ABQ3R2L0_9ACTN|nr:hypothetical protein Sviol_81330 [Streptomyces violascens]
MRRSYAWHDALRRDIAADATVQAGWSQPADDGNSDPLRRGHPHGRRLEHAKELSANTCRVCAGRHIRGRSGQPPDRPVGRDPTGASTAQPD